MRQRDMAKIGLLVLNEGRWNKKQVIPREWIQQSTSPHISESEYFDYGYYWWYRSKSNQTWWENSGNRTGDEKEMIVALGYGGQYIMIISELQMVVVTTASDFNDGRLARSKIPMAVDYIIPLLREGTNLKVNLL